MSQDDPRVAYDTLLDSPLVGVGACRCRMPRCGCGAERGDELPHIALVRRGVFMAHFGQRTLLGDPCTALYYDPLDSYRISHPIEGGDDTTIIYPSAELMAEAFPGRSGGRRLFASPLSPRSRLAHVRVGLALASGEHDRLGGEELAIGLIRTISADARGEADAGRIGCPARSRRHVARAQAFLAETFAEDVGLERLGREVGCSPFHLSRLFRQETGQTLRGYRLQLRLAAALERLAEGERDLSGLALDLGFASHSHLTSAFRQAFGAPPKTVRGEMRGAQLAA